jgi:hypothetical protein
MKGLINNDWDRDNLNFLLRISEKDYKDWHAQASEDDLVYAQELLDAYSRELFMRSEELIIESRLAETNQYNEAMNFINKVKNA